MESAPVPSPDAYLEQLALAYRDLTDRLERLRWFSVVESGGGPAWSVDFTERRIDRVAAEIERVGGRVLGPPGKDGMAARYAESMYAGGLELADAALAWQGQPAAPALSFAFEKIHEPAVRNIAQELTDGVATLHDRILRGEAGAYRTIQAEVAMRGAIIGYDVAERFEQLMQRFRAQGIAGFQDSLGRSYKLADYAHMLARTLGMKAMRTSTLLEAAQRGFDLALVVGGEMLRTCASCQQIDGKLLSISGKAYPQYENFWGSVQEAYELSPPLGHPFSCHPDSPISTARGEVSAGKLRAGDRVLTHRGRAMPLVSVKSIPHSGPIHQLRRCLVTHEHLTATSCGWQKACQVVDAKDLADPKKPPQDLQVLLSERFARARLYVQHLVALSLQPRIASRPEPLLFAARAASAIYLYHFGPLLEAEVHDIPAYRMLELVRYTEAVQKLMQGLLVLRGATDVIHAHGTRAFLNRQASGPAQRRLHGTGNPRRNFRSASRVVTAHAFGMPSVEIAGFLAQSLAPGAHRTTVDSMLPHDAHDGRGRALPSIEHLANLVESPSVFPVSISDIVEQVIVSQLGQAFAGAVSDLHSGSSIHRRNVEVKQYVGPVIDLEVAVDQSFVSGGVICHNCVHSVVPWVESGFEEFDPARAKQELNALREAMEAAAREIGIELREDQLLVA